MATHKTPSKWDTPPRRGEYDYLLRQRNEVARVTPPPEPPADQPRRRRRGVEIEIEIMRRLPPWRATDRWGLVALVAWVTWVLVFAVLLVALAGCTAAHAQTWTSYQQGFLTRHEGTDATGGQWTCTSYRQNFTTYSDFVEPALGELNRFHHGQWPSVAAQRDHQLANLGLRPFHGGPAGRALDAGQDERCQLVGHLRAVAEGEGFQIVPVHAAYPLAAFVSRCRNAGKYQQSRIVSQTGSACITYIVTGQCGYTTSSATDWFSL